MRVNTHALTVRSGPGNANAPTTWIHYGDEVTVIGSQGGWMQVETHRGTGWVYGRFLS